MAKSTFKLKYKNSAFPFKGGPEPKKVDVDKLIDYDFQDTEGTQYDIDQHNIGAHFSEGSIKKQEKIIKKK